MRKFYYGPARAVNVAIRPEQLRLLAANSPDSSTTPPDINRVDRLLSATKPTKSPKPTNTITGPPLEEEVEPTEPVPSAVSGEGGFETGGAP